MIRVFVYGTLLVGEANHHIVAPYVLSVRSGVVRGSLYDAGDYPGLVLCGADECGSGPGEGANVEGEWIVVTPEGLAVMDELEDYYGPNAVNDYERLWIRDAMKEEREGWVYAWPDDRGLPRIQESSWRRHRQRRDGC